MTAGSADIVSHLSGYRLPEIRLKGGGVADPASVKNQLTTSSESACWKIPSQTCSQKMVNIPDGVLNGLFKCICWVLLRDNQELLVLSFVCFSVSEILSTGPEVSSWTTGGRLPGPAEVHLPTAGRRQQTSGNL